MAGKKRKQPIKRSKKKTAKRKKITKTTDPKQSILPFTSTKPSTSSDNDSTIVPSHLESNESFTSDLQQHFSGASLSSRSSSGRKRRCAEEGGPLPKQRVMDLSHDYESLTEIEEEQDCTDESFMSYDEYSSDQDVFDSDNLENINFANYQKELDEAVYQDPVNIPPELDDHLCHGVGNPSEIWNLMVKKDDLDRIQWEQVQNIIFYEIKEGKKRPMSDWLSMRAMLVDWMMEVCEHEKQHRETFHLSVNYVDRYLAKTGENDVDLLQCIGTVALAIASKYEEIYPPKLESFVEYTDEACTVEQVEQMERLMLHELDWSISVMTSVHWLGTFFQLMGSGKVENGDAHYSEKPVLLPKYLRDNFMNMAKVLDLATLDAEHLKWSYREQAAAVLFLGYEPHSLVERVTGFSYAQMQPAIDWLTPCYNYVQTNITPGNPLPAVSDVNPEEWHAIQTHGNLDGKQVYNEFRQERKEKGNKRDERRRRLSNGAKPSPLSVHHPRPIRLSL